MKAAIIITAVTAFTSLLLGFAAASQPLWALLFPVLWLSSVTCTMIAVRDE